MNRNVIIVLAGGVLIAVLVAVLMSAILSGGDSKKEQVVQKLPETKIMVASQKIGAGQSLTNENVEWKTWPQSAAFPGTIRRKGQEKPAEARKAKFRRAVAQGEPITEASLIEEDSKFVVDVLAPGMRAVAIKVNAEATAGGFVAPGDYVDVMLTYRVTIKPMSEDKTIKAAQQQIIEQNVDKYTTETILQNLKVLALDQASVLSEDKAKVGKTVTLEVTPKEAEILALAQRVGNLSLSLRGVGDDKIVERTEPVTTDERLTTILDEVVKEFESQGGGGGLTGVRVYSGGEVENLPVH